MSCCDDIDTATCPCDTFVHPRPISNAPGLSVIAYRGGDYTTFRHALLLSRPDERELTRGDGGPTWRPGARGDLAVQMIEWWAYLADILTFYNGRIATQSYLRTADLPESVNRLVKLLGYRPRPGLGATGILAALAAGPKPLTLPKGFQIQSKPGPGKQPQVFELREDTVVKPLPGNANLSSGSRGQVGIDVTANSSLVKVGADNSVLLQGNSSAVKAGDVVIIAPSGSGSPLSFIARATVAAVTREKDSIGGPITRIRFDAASDLSAIDDVTKFRLLRGKQSARLWPYPASPNIVINNGTRVDLDSITRSIEIGDAVLFEVPGTPVTAELAIVAGLSEVFWFANPDNYTEAPPSSPDNPTAKDKSIAVDPAVPPGDPKARLPIPVPHTRLTLKSALANIKDADTTHNDRLRVVLRYGWQDAGQLIATLAATLDLTVGADGDAKTVGLAIQPDVTFSAALTGASVLVEDINGDGALGEVTSPTELALTLPVPALTPPLRVLFNLMNVTRGKTVLNEALGSGNAAIPGQDFPLQNAPVTYLANPASASGERYSSTVQVSVNGLQWAETQSFFGQPKDAQVFITREDEDGKTHVVFGDGEFGARLPTGAAVIATYRYGSGADSPATGTLSVLLQPRPGLRAVRNPAPVGGGSDPDSPKKLRQLAPRSVLTFGRGVSVADFESIAANTPGVVRAKAAFAYDPVERRPRVFVWVGDRADAVGDVTLALSGAVDPNAKPNVVLAKRLTVQIAVSLLLDPRRNAQTVIDAVRAAIIDPDTGVMGVNVLGIGEAVYDSQIYAACLGVPGVQAVRMLEFISFQVTSKKPVAVAACGEQRHDPGAGSYLFLPDDVQHLMITAEALS